MSASGVPMGAERESAEVRHDEKLAVHCDCLTFLHDLLLEAERENESLRGSLDEWRADFATVKAHASRLEEALERYGQHEETCQSRRILDGVVSYPVLCDCGLRIALDSETPPLITTPPGFEKPVDGNIVPLDEDDPADSETKDTDE